MPRSRKSQRLAKKELNMSKTVDYRVLAGLSDDSTSLPDGGFDKLSADVSAGVPADLPEARDHVDIVGEELVASNGVDLPEKSKKSAKTQSVRGRSRSRSRSVMADSVADVVVASDTLSQKGANIWRAKSEAIKQKLEAVAAEKEYLELERKLKLAELELKQVEQGAEKGSLGNTKVGCSGVDDLGTVPDLSAEHAEQLVGLDSGKTVGLSANNISLDDLKELKQLEVQATNVLKGRGLTPGFVEQDSALNFVAGPHASQGVTKLKGNKSGLDIVKNDCIVVNPQRCPHTHLRNEFAAVNVRFRDLSLRLFVAGEIEIISQTVDAVERRGRENMLRRIMYHAGKYDWRFILDFYAAVIKSIEYGEKSWGDSFQDVEHMVLGMRVPQIAAPSASSGFEKSGKFETTSSASSKAVLFCAPFQRGVCSVSDHAHDARLWGRQVVVRHICARCWQENKVLSAHGQNSADCPLQLKSSQAATQ